MNEMGQRVLLLFSNSVHISLASVLRLVADKHKEGPAFSRPKPISSSTLKITRKAKHI
jgi:hypothetical protein